MTTSAYQPVAETEPGVLRRWGTTSWMLVGIIVLSAISFSVFGALGGLMVPLVLAVVIGTLGVPVVDWFERRRIPRPVGAAVFLAVLFASVVVSVGLVVSGVIDQGQEISDQVTAGLDRVDVWLEGLDIDLGSAENGVDQAGDVLGNLLPGVASWIPGVFTSAFSFFMGGFISLFLLYYILTDWTSLRDWLSRHLGVGHDMGTGILDDATFILRQGFYALSLSSLVTAVIIGGAMVALDVPLAFTVALVTFVTSYIPYLGAIIAGAFAFLVALGAEGLQTAIILLAVILIVQNLVQTVVQTKMTSERLSLHPIASLASTIVGAAVAGLLGATLSAPILATVLAVITRVRASHEAGSVAPAGQAADVPASAELQER